FRILRAILALPGMVLGAVPALLVAIDGGVLRAVPWPLVALAPAALGLGLMAWTITLFARRGRGTLAPWDAPTRLVVAGPFRHMRNPMMVGVLLVLVGEVTAFRAPLLIAWLAVALLAVLLFIPMIEEKRLARRFGADYDRYRSAVPRWLPRLKPWTGDS
ncbi:MAG: methyltransferase family protein, partial [Planctomycetota bacterium]